VRAAPEAGSKHQDVLKPGHGDFGHQGRHVTTVADWRPSPILISFSRRLVSDEHKTLCQV
jgi:hypothetical protein